VDVLSVRDVASEFGGFSTAVVAFVGVADRANR